MSAPQQSNLRWIALLLALAVVASAAITYALVLLTSPTGGDRASAADGLSSALLSAATDHGSANSEHSDSMPPSNLSTDASSATTTAMTPSPSSAGSALSTPATTMPTVSTATSVLRGSGVIVPAAWTGTAKVTVTVRGECATTTPSVYTDVPADLALDLSQNESAAPDSEHPTTVPNGVPTLTLGINANELPRIAVYSAAVDETGQFQQFWQLALTPEEHRTVLHARMQNNSETTSNPNTLADSETSLQPCESSDTVPVPRVLAPGSTLDGYVSATQAKLTLHATTTDGKRAVTVQFSALRK